MADPGIQRSTFIVKHNGSTDSSIKKNSVQEPGKVWAFSRQDKTNVPDGKLNPAL